TMEPGALQRKCSRHPRAIACNSETATAAATRRLLQRKCVPAAPISGRAPAASASGENAGGPPSAAYAAPAAFTVMTCEAMLKSSRCVERGRDVKAHWLHAPAAATIIVWSAPRSSSEATWTACDAEMEELPASGMGTFSVEAAAQAQMRMTSRRGFAIESGANTEAAAAPAATPA